MLHLKTAKLARWQIHLLCWSGAALWVSGITWLLLHNFFQLQGEFGPETNPAEPWLLRLHGAAMLVAMLGTGSLLVVHIWRGWSYRSQRVLGTALMTVLGGLIVTGYLLYYVTDDVMRETVSLIHWIVGVIIMPLFLIHYRQGKRVRRS